MKTEIKHLHPHEVALFCDIYDLGNIELDSKLVKAWNGNYIETMVIVNGNNLKLITKLSGLDRTLSSIYYSLHPVYYEYERYYLGDNIIINENDRIFTESEMIKHHQINFAKLLEYEKRRNTV
jgi:hypothetical protein